MAAKENEESPVFVNIKSEYIDCDVSVKIEPPDRVDDKPECTENTTEIEDVTVKIEPICYESEGEPYLEEEHEMELPLVTYKSLMMSSTRKHKRRTQSDSDEDYIPRKKKKKVKEDVKKTYTTKAKKKENLYSEEVTKHIEVVTITEEERLEEFNEIWQSRKHMRYACQHCAVGFVLEGAYIVHMKSHSPEMGDYECDICHSRSRSADMLYRHRLRHHRRYRCTRCRRLHKDKETAASHVMSRHTRLAFPCPHCARGFRRPAYLKKHVAQQHDKSQRHACPAPDCDRVFYDKSALRSHYRNHNEETRRYVVQPVVCDTCSRQFPSKAHLLRHLPVHRAGRALPCPHCAAPYTSRRGLRLHVHNQHTDRPSAAHAQCPQCPRACTTPALLRLHISRMHTNRVKKYQCDHCQRLYYSKGELRSHIQWSHLRRSARAPACHCGQVFRTSTRLRNHINLHHLKIAPERTHVCHCGKSFASKPVLARHMRSHEGLTYPCPECGLRFKSEPYVKVHHQLKHLNMTRAEIKALKKPREIHFLEGNKIKTVVLSGSKKERTKKIKENETCEAMEKISVPLFDFVDLKREIE